MTAFAIDDGSANVRGGLNIVRFDWVIAVFGLVLVIALQFPLIWQRSIHWDEFFHFSQVHQFANGTLAQPIQTLKARLFMWVLDMSGSSIDHIVTIRFAMFAFELVAALAIAGVAARFTDWTTGIIAAAAYIGGGFVFQHGFSYRADPMAAGLLMVALWLLLCTRMRAYQLLICGFLIGLATMVTIKAILFAPAFIGIAWLRWNEEQRSIEWVARMIALGVAAVCTFAIVYLWHSQGLVDQTGNAGRGLIQSSANKMFGIMSVPYLLFALKQTLLAPALSAILVLFPGELLRSRFLLHERIALGGLFAPLLTLFFYHNTAPYYYTFMLPPVVAASAIVIASFRKKFGTLIVAGLFAFSALMLWSKETSEPIRNQKLLTAVANEMFPEGVSYLDFCAFLGEFSKANAFMTPWGIELYKAGKYASILDTLNSKIVPLVMENDPMFTRLLATDAPVPEFLPQDAAAMRKTYIRLWGPYWIAGKEISSSSENEKFVVHVPGPYTVHGAGISIDGRSYARNGIVILNRGVYLVGATDGAAKLVWGRHIKPPVDPAPTTPFWTPF